MSGIHPRISRFGFREAISQSRRDRHDLRTSDEQWDFPNGWAPHQRMAYVGLKRYKHDALAEKVRGRRLILNREVYRRTRNMMENYNVVNTNQVVATSFSERSIITWFYKYGIVARTPAHHLIASESDDPICAPGFE